MKENRNHHLYPEILSLNGKSDKQSYWYHLWIECNCVEEMKQLVLTNGCDQPGATALQVTLQPDLVLVQLQPVSSSSVLNMNLTVLLVLVILGGRREPIFIPSPNSILPSEEEPQALFNSVVPSPSSIVKWSVEQNHLWGRSNEMKCRNKICPFPTCIVCILWRLPG